MAQNIVEGNPTKTFFIGMITRDISIKDAILDLLDNSIDGAHKINPDSYEGLSVDIIINEEEFTVTDNCGGFSLETAQKYAFRFGRPDDAEDIIGSIGRFGIGMKRALFKMGKSFEVESKTDQDHFQVNVDVPLWRNKKTKITLEDGSEKEVEDWNFRYEFVTDDTANLGENGTYISVKNLYDEVAELFGNESFLNSLREDIERLLNFSLEKGLRISLNGLSLNPKNIKIFKGESDPYFYETSKDGVNIRIFAGLGEVGDPSVSGWYIYCNNRLVVEADRSEITGWDTGSLPKWHVDHVMFRGIVFFDSPDTIKLPLTTTKKGIDATSEVYKTALGIMKDAMLNVIQFLKLITKLEEPNAYRIMLGEQEDRLSVVDMKNNDFIPERTKKFINPPIDPNTIAMKKDHVRIAYSVKTNDANAAKYYIKSKAYKEVGEYTFNYFMKMEGLYNE